MHMFSWPWQVLRWMFIRAVNQTPSFWLIASALVLAALITAWRMGRFTAPATPLMSAYARDFSRYLIFWPTALLTVAALCFWTALLGLGWYLDVPDPAWQEITTRAARMVTGGMIGMLAALPIYYFLIPGMETPKATMASPDARVKARKSFDPEPFFKLGEAE